MVEFWSRDGHLLGTKETLKDLVSEITGIPLPALCGASLSDFTTNERLRWASQRETKKQEDKAYCLLGLFGIFLPPIYGEGENAFNRLKREIETISQLPQEPSPSAGETTVQQRRRDLLESLSFDQIDSRQSSIKDAQRTTCEWILQHETYINWNKRDKPPRHREILWIAGKPGAGKSTLMKFALARARKSKLQNEIILSFFFNARGDELEKTTMGMYRSLLLQLLTEGPDLQSVLDNVHASKLNQIQTTTWSLETLQDLLSTALQSLGGRRVKCFIDALDECDEQQVREMVEFFEDLGEHIFSDYSRLDICFASRHYPTIKIHDGWSLVLDDEAGHADDLRKYIQRRLQAGKGKLVNEIQAQIEEKANGVFMWAVLVVDILNEEFRRGRIFAVRQRLQEIPTKLGDLFKDILRRDCVHMDDLLLCLQWILFAQRPLRCEEFYFAMVAGLDPVIENMTEWDPENVTLDRMNRLVLDSSKGLAELTKSKEPTVQFIHESVRDFLLKDGGLRELWPKVGEHLSSASHEVLKRGCLKYLNANYSGCIFDGDTFPKASSDEAKDRRRRLTAELPFLEYASQHVLFHANEAASEILQDDFLKAFHLKNLLNVSRQLERYEVRRHTTDASLVYVLAEQNCARLIHTARDCGYNLNCRGERYQFPILVAVANCHRAAIAAILQQDETLAEKIVNQMSVRLWRKISVHKSHTPLSWALENGQQTLAEALLTSSAATFCSFESESRYHRSLLIAADKGHERIVNLLLTLASPDVNATDEFHHTALEIAASRGHVAIAQALIQKGATTDDGDNGRSPTLLLATERGSKEMIRLLIERGVNIDATDCNGMTSLSWAAASGQEGAAQLLVDRGANIQAKDLRGRTALSRAAYYGSEMIIQLLIDRGADIEAAAIDGRTALIEATDKGNSEAVQLLLQRGANVEAMNNRGQTSLSRATARRDGRIVRILLAFGASVDAKDENGSTALSRAVMDLSRDILHGSLLKIQSDLITRIRSRLKHVIQVLLANGAQPDVPANDGTTALTLATERGSDDIVQLLIERDTNIGPTPPRSPPGLYEELGQCCDLTGGMKPDSIHPL